MVDEPGDVKAIPGSPTARKKFSCPVGEQTHSSRAGRPEAFVKACRGVGRHVDRLTGPGDQVPAAEGELHLAVEHGEHLLEVMAVGSLGTPPVFAPALPGGQVV